MGKQQEPKVHPWDRRPWPTQGEADKNAIYAAVGQALTHWEQHEVSLALLFGTFVSPFNSYAARRAYVAVRTFEGRADMLRAASSAYFEQMPSIALQEQFKSVLRNATSYSPRRNDIAHAAVDFFIKDANRLQKGIFARNKGEQFALYPSVASFKERDLGGVPSYCMVVEDLDYFAQKFEDCIIPTVQLQKQIGSIWNAEIASRYKLVEPDQP